MFPKIPTNYQIIYLLLKNNPHLVMKLSAEYIYSYVLFDIHSFEKYFDLYNIYYQINWHLLIKVNISKFHILELEFLSCRLTWPKILIFARAFWNFTKCSHCLNGNVNRNPIAVILGSHNVLDRDALIKYMEARIHAFTKLLPNFG